MSVVVDVEEVEQVSGGKLVTMMVGVSPPRDSALQTADARARARALFTVGPLDVLRRGLNDLSQAEIERFTEIRSRSKVEEKSVSTDYRYEVFVKVF